MNRIKSFIAIGAFSLLVLALPAVASAQWGGRNDDYYGNSRYGYGNIRGTIQSLENRARNFERQVDRIDDRRDRRQDRYDPYGRGSYDPYGRGSYDPYGRDRYGRNGRTDRFDNLDQLAQSFRDAAENLADEFGRGRNMNNSRDEAQRVISIGSQIDQVMFSSANNRRVGNRANIESQWRQIDSDLRTIARAYGLNYSSRNNTGWRNRIPFPLPF